MLRMVIFLIGVLLLALGAAWLADRPGELVVNWLGYQIETSVFAAIILLVLAGAALLVSWSGLRGLITAPKRIARALRKRRETRGRDALRLGMFAVGAGDARLAARSAAEASRALPNEPLTKLLRAQSAQLSGDHVTARRVFETLLDASETRLLGLHGLFLEARRESQIDAAEQFAGRAIAINPGLPWALEALFELQCSRGDWDGALKTLASARQYKQIDRGTADRRRAVILTAKAQKLEETDPERAADYALEAHRLSPELVPAAEIAGRALAGQGYTSRAAKVIAATWVHTPHPDLAVVYAYARPGDSPHDRLARIRKLIRNSENSPESHIALASAAIDAHEWETAREALAPLLPGSPSARICTLMARIEAGERRKTGRVREWLARALRAPRDPAWVADGVVSDRWAPISPVTRRLDAFEWRVPEERLAARTLDSLADEIAALERLGALEAESGEASEQALPIKTAAPALATGAAAPPPTSPVQPAPAETAPAETHDEVPVRGQSAKTGARDRAAVIVASAPEAARPSAARPAPAASAQSSSFPAREAGDGAAPASIAAPSAFVQMPAEKETSMAAITAGSSISADETTAAPQIAGDEPARETFYTTLSPEQLSPQQEGASHGEAVAQSAVKRRSRPARSEPAIFVPERPPDDPGPEPIDPDEASTPLTRYRAPSRKRG